MDGLVVGAATIAAYTGQRAIDLAVDKLVAGVFRLFAERRAHEWFRALAVALGSPTAEPVNEAQIAHALDVVTKDGHVSETVFEFYRSALLARSRQVGPRLLALIAARLLRERRGPTASERQMTEIAEACTDDEILEFSTFYSTVTSGSTPNDVQKVERENGGFRLLLLTESDSLDSTRVQYSGPINLGDRLGLWAAKFELVGAIIQSTETTRKMIPADSEMYQDEDVVKITTRSYLLVNQVCTELDDLVRLASKAS